MPAAPLKGSQCSTLVIGPWVPPTSKVSGDWTAKDHWLHGGGGVERGGS